MKHSIFWKLALIILPMSIIINAAALFITYRMTYDSNMEHCREDVCRASRSIAKQFEMFDPEDLADTASDNESFTELCSVLGMTYICAVKPDLQKNTLQYLAVGFGAEAAESARKTRYTGVVVPNLYAEERAAFEGKTDVFREESNEFGDTIICYNPVVRHYSQKTGGMVENEIKSIVSAEMSVNDVRDAFQHRFRIAAAFVPLTTLLLVLVTALFFSRFVSKPARKISRRMTGFVSDREKEFVPLEVKGSDEFSEMASSFNSMAEEIDRYIADISELNRQKTRQEAELQIASTIQLGLLEPPSFQNRAAEIYASMQPAKNVGGDLYDYQVLPDGSICIVIADVSGKGITAALFMSRAITLLHQYTEAGLSPSCILREYNKHLASRNSHRMFITTFVAIYHPDTMQLTYSNGGHNIPYLLSDKLIALDGARSVATGIFKNADYKECTVQLKPGDSLFLYTDGVTEAANPAGDMYGDEALCDVLRSHLGEPPKKTMHDVLDSVAAFVQNAPQSDDITVLTMTVKANRAKATEE